MYQKELQTAKKAVKEGGKILKKLYGKQAEEKEKENWQEIVTKADIKANEKIVNILKKNFPSYSIFSEESAGEKMDDSIWYVDPLDGTTNFVTHIPFFCSAVGLVKNGVPLVGAVYDPIANEMFYASAGKGAFLNGKRITASKNREIKKTLINYCHKNKREDVEKIGKIWIELKMLGRDLRRLGSGNLDIAFVASGRNDAYFSNSKIFDIAPSIIIAKEAGCKITDWNGREWEISSENIAITNGYIHNELLNVLRKI